MGRDEIRDADALADSSLCGWAFHPPCLIRIHPPMSRCNCLLYKRSQWCHSGRRNRWNVSNAPLDSDFYPSPECWRNSGTGPIARIGSSSVSRASQFYNNASTDDSIRSRANVNSTSQFNRAISRCLIASRRTWIAGAIISTAPTLVPSTGSAPTEGRLTLYSINAWICRKLSARKTGAITSGKRRFLADGRHQGSPPRVAPPDVLDAV